MDISNKIVDRKIAELVVRGFYVSDLVPLLERLHTKCGVERGDHLFNKLSSVLCLAASIEAEKPDKKKTMPGVTFDLVADHLKFRLDMCPPIMEDNDYEGCLRDLEDKERMLIKDLKANSLSQRKRPGYTLH